MLNFLTTYGLFLLKIATIVAAVLFFLASAIAIATKGKSKPREKIAIRKINDKYDELKHAIEINTLGKREYKLLEKKRRKEEKIKSKQEKKKGKGKGKNKLKTKEEVKAKKRIFVLNFEGDIRASAAENLREEITAVLTSATPQDEVLVCLESAGGMVSAYGFAASQLRRIRDKNIPLVVAVDKVAASGGYMMACVADKIIAAPFAVLGSIGVLAQLPNFHKLLKKHDIEFEQITAGEYKRTLTMFGENTSKGRKKMQEEVEETHELFKKFIAENRPKVSLAKISTGEHWYAARALQLKLIDEIKTSDDYLLNACDASDVYEVVFTIRKNLSERIPILLQKGIEKLGLIF